MRSPFGALLGCSARDDFAHLCVHAARRGAAHSDGERIAAEGMLAGELCNRDVIRLCRAIASAPRNEKATILREEARAMGIELPCPALDDAWPASPP